MNVSSDKRAQSHIFGQRAQIEAQFTNRTDKDNAIAITYGLHDNPPRRLSLIQSYVDTRIFMHVRCWQWVKKRFPVR